MNNILLKMRVFNFVLLMLIAVNMLAVSATAIYFEITETRNPLNLVFYTILGGFGGYLAVIGIKDIVKK